RADARRHREVRGGRHVGVPAESSRASVCVPAVVLGTVKLQVVTTPAALLVQLAMVAYAPPSTEDLMALLAPKPLPLTDSVAAGVPVLGLSAVICAVVEKLLVEVVFAEASFNAKVCEPPVLDGTVKLQADTAPAALAVQLAMVANDP